MSVCVCVCVCVTTEEESMCEHAERVLSMREESVGERMQKESGSEHARGQCMSEHGESYVCEHGRIVRVRASGERSVCEHAEGESVCVCVFVCAYSKLKNRMCGRLTESVCESHAEWE
jgi:hypothetical protein